MHTSMKIRKGADFQAKALAIAMKRKEEYLGARVPRELKERVIRRAEELGIPVSILLRKVLEDAFGDQRGGAAALQTVSEDRRNEAIGVRRYPAVLGWESIRLNKSVSCTGCGSELKAGKQIIMGVASPEEERILLCDICKESL